MEYSRELTKEEIEKIERSSVTELKGNFIEREEGSYEVTNELGETVNYLGHDPVIAIQGLTIPGTWRYKKVPSGFTGYAWYVKDKANDVYFGLDDDNNFAWTSGEDAIKCYTKSIAMTIKDKFENLIDTELSITFEKDWHW